MSMSPVLLPEELLRGVFGGVIVPSPTTASPPPGIDGQRCKDKFYFRISNLYCRESIHQAQRTQIENPPKFSILAQIRG